MYNNAIQKSFAKAAGLVGAFFMLLTAALNAQYCIPTYVNLCDDVASVTSDYVDDFVTTDAVVNVSNINTGCFNDDGYIFYAGMQITAAQGCSVNFTIQSGPQFAQSFRIWFDYNLDGDFNDTGELLYSSPAPTLDPIAGQITLPANSPLGLTRIRVRSTYNVLPANACSEESYGETEDYPLLIVPSPIGNATLVASNDTICAGQTATITPTTNTTLGTFEFFANLSATVPLFTGPSFTTPNLFTSKTYYVRVKVGSCYSDKIPVTITVSPSMTLTIASSTPTACAGTPFTLTASGTYASYTWQPASALFSNTGNPVTATISAPTLFTVTATNSFGCTRNATINVGVTAVLPLLVTATPPSVCPGASSTLTASGGGATYSWTAASGLPASSGATVIANPTATTTYFVNSPAAPGTCPAAGSVTVTIVSAPAVSAGSAVGICSGATGTLSASGGASYSWSPAIGLSNSLIATPSVNSLTASPSYTVTVTNAQGCSATDQVNVTVHPLPIANPGQNAANCSGTGALLSGSGGLTYLWSPLAGLSNAAIAAPVATPATTTNYSLSVTDANGCISLPSAPVTVTVFQQPPAPAINPGGPTTFCSGGSVVLTSSAGSSYLWSNGATTPSITVNASGSYSVTIVDVNGCTSPVSPALTVTVNAPPATPVITAGGPTSLCLGGAVLLTSSIATSYLWSNGSTAQTVNASLTGNYTVTVTGPSGCTAVSAPMAVTINSNPASPVITASGAASFCPGGNVTLQAPLSASYNWSNGSVAQSITVNASGSFTVIVTDGNGCVSPTSSTFATTLFNAPATPVISASGDITFCEGYSVNLSSSPAASYMWSNSATTSAITVSEPGDYQVSIVDFNGCPSSPSSPLNVTVLPLPSAPVVLAAGGVIFCEGETVDLTTNQVSGITWNTGGTALTNTIDQTGIYSATFTDANGCTSYSSNQIFVTVNPRADNPEITASGPLEFCLGDSVVLTATVADTYLWSTGAYTQSIAVREAGSYMVSVTAACPPAIDNDDVYVEVRPLPEAIITADITKDCAPVSINLSAVVTGAGPYEYDWNFGDGDNSNGIAPEHVYSSEGIYDVTLQLTDNIGCLASFKNEQYIEILPRAVINYKIFPKVTTITNPYVTFSALTPNTSSHVWDLGVFGIFTDDTVRIHFLEIGSYPVKYDVTTAEGCHASAIDTVTIINDFALYMPDAFTPDGNELNDVLIPIFTGLDESRYSFEVYNRWGQLVFATTKPGVGWDGENAIDGNYVWRITGKGGAGEFMELYGNVILLR